MMCPAKVGTAWSQKETGDCVIVVTANRTGHQYDRYWQLEVLHSDGTIRTVDDYVLLAQYESVKSERSAK